MDPGSRADALGRITATPVSARSHLGEKTLKVAIGASVV